MRFGSLSWSSLIFSLLCLSQATRDTDLITLTTSDLCSKSYPQKSLRARLYNRFSKSIPRNLRLYRLDYNSMIRSLSEHFQKHHVLVQGVSSQLQKLSQSFSNSRDHDLLEQNLQRLLTLSGGCDRIKRVLDFLRKIRELNRKGEENWRLNLTEIMLMAWANIYRIKLKLDRTGKKKNMSINCIYPISWNLCQIIWIAIYQ